MDVLVIGGASGTDKKPTLGLLVGDLEAEGCRISASESITDAETRIRNHPFDLILIDLDRFFSVSDQTYFFQKIKTIYPKPHVVAVTGSNSYEMEKAVRRYGVISYMTKPVSKESLGLIIEHLTQRQAQDAAIDPLKKHPALPKEEVLGNKRNT